MIKLNECDSLVQGTSYPSMTRFKVWVGKVYMGEYDKAEMVRKFGDKKRLMIMRQVVGLWGGKGSKVGGNTSL